MKFYHLDRASLLAEMKSIELTPISSIDIQTSLPSIKQHFENWIDDGSLSNHGIQYISDSFEGKNINAEWFLEYERRLFHKDKPSRFQSILAFDSIEDVDRFVSEYNIQERKIIYELECKEFFKADMKLLGNQSSPLVQSFMSNAYWSGKALNEIDDQFSTIDPLWEYLLVPPVRIIGKVKV